MSQSSSRTATALVVLALLGTALAGCLTDSTRVEGDSVARLLVVTADREHMEKAQNATDAETALRDLVDASLVVRVKEAGDYVIAYTAKDGSQKNETLVGLSPGSPRTIPGAHPFAPVTLSKAGSVVATRAAPSHEWWRVGDVPVGIVATPGSGIQYATSAVTKGELTLQDLDLGDAQGKIQSLSARIDAPFAGTASWALVAGDAEGDRLDVTTTAGLAATTNDVLGLEVAGTQAHDPFAAGLTVPPFPLTSTLSGSLFVKNGEIVASRSGGSHFASAPVLRVWATGENATKALGDKCPAGATKAVPCTIADLGKSDTTTPPGEIQRVPADEFKVDTPDEQKALAILRAVFSEDIVPGDQLTVKGALDEKDLGMGSGEGGTLDASATLEMIVGEKESLVVPAGTFDALKITETFRTKVVANDLPTGESDGPKLGPVNIDETVARTTIWLDASTYMPLKVTAEAPLDLNAVYRAVLAATPDAFWTQMGAKKPSPNSFHVSFDTHAEMVATKVTGESAVAPVVGLTLANALSTGLSTLTAGPATAITSMGGFGRTTESAEVQAFKSLSLTSAGALAGTTKAYTIAAVSPDVAWSDIALTVDGSAIAPSDCADPGPFPGYAVTEGDTCIMEDEPIAEGQTLTLHGVHAGETLRVLDAAANSVILTLVIG